MANGTWHYLVRPLREHQALPVSFVAMAKREPFQTYGDFIAEPGELWFEFGATEEEALARIMAECG